jgi:O-antigen ligase
MNSVNKLNRHVDSDPTFWIFTGLFLVTVYIQPNLTDPFNSPKMWILSVIASWLFGYILIFRRIIFKEKLKFNVIFWIGIFVFSVIITSLFSEFKYTAIFGEAQRRNGLITYISLSTFFLASSMFIRISNVGKLIITSYLVATISASYALMQISGNDFLEWNNPYNPIITTVGNPNFAAALMAIVGVISFASIFVTSYKPQLRIFAGILTFMLLISIYLSDARQGLLSYGIGVGVFLVFWIVKKSKKLGVLAITGSFIVFTFSIFGMLQIGPLERFLYKPSVTVRGYYWRAAFEMFKEHPLFGVGMDRYGYYFKEYRLPGYPLKYGFELNSTNAHNTFLQFFATGGVLLGISYLALNLFVLKRALYALKKYSGNQKIIFTGVFSAWIAFHSQSFVSIDNIGVSIWGWVLGGTLVGLSQPEPSEKNLEQGILGRKRNQLNTSRALISGSMGVCMLILSSVLYQGESNSFKTKTSFNLQDQKTREFFRNLQLKAINTPLIDPQYSFNSAIDLIRGDFLEDGIREIHKIQLEDPRNLDALIALSTIYEQKGEILKAIEYRKQLASLDKWNAANYLALGKDYKSIGDIANSKIMLDTILSFASNHPIATQAKLELAP